MDMMGPACRNEPFHEVMNVRQLMQSFGSYNSIQELFSQSKYIGFLFAKTYMLIKISAAEERLQGNSAC